MQPFAVVTDIQMPVMGRAAALASVRAQRCARCRSSSSRPNTFRIGDASLGKAPSVIIRKPVHVEDLLSALEAAQAHRAAHLPLQRLWRAAGVAPPTRREGVSRSRWHNLRRLGSSLCSSASAMHIVMFTLALASSFAVFKYWRGKVS